MCPDENRLSVAPASLVRQPQKKALHPQIRLPEIILFIVILKCMYNYGNEIELQKSELYPYYPNNILHLHRF